MLYKPTNPSPYNSVVDPTKGVNLQASCINTDSVTRLSLIIDNNTHKNYFPLFEKNEVNGEENFTSLDIVSFNDGEINVSLDNDTSLSGYKITNTNSYRTTIEEQEICSDLLVSPRNYTWQIRLYQEQLLVNIAYGFIQEVYDVFDTDGVRQYVTHDYVAHSSETTTHILKVRPHTNMFFYAGSGFNSNNLNYAMKPYTEYYDESVKYAININGISYEVKAYYYSSNKVSYSDGTTYEGFKLQTDSYGDPLFAYIEIEAEDDAISADDEYSIYTNYIDSNEFPFQCRTDAVLTLYNRSGEEITNFTDGTEPDDSSILSSKHSNFKLTSTITNASINYYNIKLYQMSDTNEEMLLHTTGNIYNQNIEYEYNNLLSGNTYKLIVQTVDTNKRTITKSIYIKPEYSVAVEPKNLIVKPYPEHGSIILDFDELVSIGGQEKIEGRHDFCSLKAIWDGENEVYEITEDGTDGSFSILGGEIIDTNSCVISNDNIITYDKIDVSNKPLECENPLLSMTFKCVGSNYQRIFVLTDDDGIVYSLIWNNHTFYYRSGKNNSWAKYCPYGETALSSEVIESHLSTNELDYSVPYLAYEDINTGDINTNEEYYYHTESVAHDFWWHVIIKPNYFYIKCLNPPDGYSWTYEKR